MIYYKLDNIYSKGEISIKEVKWKHIQTTMDSKGISLANTKPVVCILDNSSGKKVDYVIGTKLAIVSDTFKNLLEYDKADREFLEFIPVAMKGKSKISKPYWFLNILSNIKCFDWDNSEFSGELTNANGDRCPQNVTRLELNSEAIGQRNIFRMFESRGYIFISDKLKMRIEQAELKGIAFKDIKHND